MSIFFNRYKSECAKRGIEPVSQKAADLCGVQRATISMWDKRDTVPKGDTIARIAKAFGVSSDYLLGITDSPDASASTTTDNINAEPIEHDKAFARMIDYVLALRPDESETIAKILWSQLDDQKKAQVIGFMTALKGMGAENGEGKD